MEKISKDEKKIYDSIAKDRAEEFRNKYLFSDINSLEILKEFYILKFPNELGISGAYIRKKGREKDYNCIYINTADPIGRQNFSLLHELYHVFYEKSNELVSLSKMIEFDPVEYKAERFASYVLIPREKLISNLKKIKFRKVRFFINIKELLSLQKKFQCSFIALIYAINDLKSEESDLVPLNIHTFWRYKNKDKWSELEAITEKYNCDGEINLNKSDNLQIWPKGLKENIYKNISDGLIEEYEVEDLIDFFEEE